MLPLLLVALGPQARQPLDVVNTVFHAAISDGEHQILLLLRQQPGTLFDSRLQVCCGVSVEVFGVDVVGGADPVLFLSDIGAHLQNLQVDFGFEFVFGDGAAGDRVGGQEPLL